MKHEKQPGVLVYVAGIATSALALFLSRALIARGVNVMGWYVNGILPVGATLVGMVSGVGFALASRYLNVRLTRSYVLGMITTGVLDYIAAQYFAWQSLLETHQVSAERYSLWQYFRDTCENMSFRSSSSSGKGAALGSFGYFFKALEVAGFALGSMLPSAILFSMPYCRSCQRYLLKHKSGFINAAARRDETLRLAKGERPAALQAAVNEVSARASQLFARVRDADLAGTVAALAETAPLDKGAVALVTVTLKKCPTCDSHHMDFSLQHSTVDKRVARASLLTVDKPQAAAA